MLMLLAGIHVASLAAGTFSIVTALSLYRRPERRKVTEHFFAALPALTLRRPLGISAIIVRRHAPGVFHARLRRPFASARSARRRSAPAREFSSAMHWPAAWMRNAHSATVRLPRCRCRCSTST